MLKFLTCGINSAVTLDTKSSSEKLGKFLNIKTLLRAKDSKYSYISTNVSSAPNSTHSLRVYFLPRSSISFCICFDLDDFKTFSSDFSVANKSSLITLLPSSVKASAALVPESLSICSLVSLPSFIFLAIPYTKLKVSSTPARSTSISSASFIPFFIPSPTIESSPLFFSDLSFTLLAATSSENTATTSSAISLLFLSLSVSLCNLLYKALSFLLAHFKIVSAIPLNIALFFLNAKLPSSCSSS